MKKRFLIWDNPKDAIISLTLLLMLVGCINVFSASFVEARDMFEDGYYYLMNAEGGTGPNHSMTISRSRSVWFES